MTDETDFHASAGQGYARIGALEEAVNAHTPMLTNHSVKIEEVSKQCLDLFRLMEEMRNDVSLITGLQRSHMDIEERLKKIEDSDNSVIHVTAESLVQAGRRIEKLEAQVFPKPPVTTFDTIDRLINAIEQIFDCKDGLYGSYALGGRKDELRYRTLGLITENEDHPFERLRMELMKDFAAIAMVTPLGGDKPILYWRFAKEMRIEEESSPSFERRGKIYKIRTRVAIPEWSKWGILRSHAEEGAKYRSID